MRRVKYGLSADEGAWIEDVLSNDEASTDAELMAYFASNGLSQVQASSVLSHRQDYLLNTYPTGHGPLHEAKGGIHPCSR